MGRRCFSVGSTGPAALLRCLLQLFLLLATSNSSTHTDSLFETNILALYSERDAEREICRAEIAEVAELRKKIAALAKENFILLRQKDTELATSTDHGMTSTKKFAEKQVPTLSALSQHDAIIGLDNKPNAAAVDNDDVNNEGSDATDESAASLNSAASVLRKLFEPFEKQQQKQFEFDHEMLARNKLAPKIEDIPHSSRSERGLRLAPSRRLLVTCEFSNKENGDFIVPPTGCKLSQMITVSGVMRVDGVQGESPLRELVAMGGTPDVSNPKRHFRVPGSAELVLKHLRLTGGTVWPPSASDLDSYQCLCHGRTSGVGVGYASYCANNCYDPNVACPLGCNGGSSTGCKPRCQPQIIVIWSHCEVVPSGLGVVLPFPFVLSFLKGVEPIL